jgi:hypothetical protein
MPEEGSSSRFLGVLSIPECPYWRDECAGGKKGENFLTSDGMGNAFDCPFGVPDSPATCLVEVFTGEWFQS